MNGHHLILGQLVDFITGRTLDDTHDERYRQQIARLLVEEKGYAKQDVLPGEKILVSAGKSRAHIPLDFVIRAGSMIGMIIKYGPGSIVTRHRPALALSRIYRSYQVPVVVVTNGHAAEVLDGITGKTISHGLETIPTKAQLLNIVSGVDPPEIPKKRFEMESRILYAYEVDGACPCDDTVCRL